MSGGRVKALMHLDFYAVQPFIQFNVKLIRISRIILRYFINPIDDNIDLGFRMINDSYIDIDTIYIYTYSVYIYIYIVIYSKVKMDVNRKRIPPVL